MQLTDKQLDRIIRSPKSIFIDVMNCRESLDQADEKILRLRSSLMSISVNPGDGTQGSGYPRSKTEDGVIRLVEMSKHRDIKMDMYTQSVNLAKYVLTTFVESPVRRGLMYEHYINQKTWNMIAAERSLSLSALYKNQAKVFEEITEKACTYTPICDKI